MHQNWQLKGADSRLPVPSSPSQFDFGAQVGRKHALFWRRSHGGHCGRDEGRNFAANAPSGAGFSNAPGRCENVPDQALALTPGALSDIRTWSARGRDTNAARSLLPASSRARPGFEQPPGFGDARGGRGTPSKNSCKVKALALAIRLSCTGPPWPFLTSFRRT